MTERFQGKAVLVDGASGYVGSHLIAYLLKEGAQVRALIRPGVAQAHKDFLRNLGAELIQAELTSSDLEERRLLEGAFADCDFAVHLIGSIAPSRGETLSGLHQGQSSAFAGWCMRARALGRFNKVVMVTALGASPDSPSQYLRTKYEAEQALFAAFQNKLAAVVLRPSLIVGRQVGLRDSKLISRYRLMVRTRPFVPLIGGGVNKLEPIFVGDLVEAIGNCLLGPESGVLEIGGSIVSMRELVLELMRLEGVEKPLFTLPAVAAGLLASVLEKVQNVPLLSGDQVVLSGLDNVCADNAAQGLLERQPLTWQEALATYGR